MAKVNYYLKNVPSKEKLLELKKANAKAYNALLNEKRPILLSVAYWGKREVLSTGKSIPIKLWDREQQRIKRLIETTPEILEQGEWLDSKKIEVERYLQQCQSDGINLSKSELSKILSRRTGDKKNTKDLLDILNEFLISHKTSDGNNIKPNTIKVYKTLIKHIEGYQGHKGFQIEMYTTIWAKEFKEYLIAEKKFNDNTTCKYIKSFKSFFNELSKIGYKTNIRMDELTVTEKEQIVVSLEIDEISILENAVFESPTHSAVRDLFLFQCYTGARFSDIRNFKREGIRKISDELDAWQYTCEKNQITITAPLHKKAKAILKKYSDRETPLPTYSNQFVNEKLKEIGKYLKLDRLVKQNSYHNNVISETYQPLYKLISTHKARKTFISLMLQKDVDERDVRAISGHKDERSFRRYVNLGNKPLISAAKVWDSL